MAVVSDSDYVHLLAESTLRLANVRSCLLLAKAGRPRLPLLARPPLLAHLREYK